MSSDALQQSAAEDESQSKEVNGDHVKLKSWPAEMGSVVLNVSADSLETDVTAAILLVHISISLTSNLSLVRTSLRSMTMTLPLAASTPRELI